MLLKSKFKNSNPMKKLNSENARKGLTLIARAKRKKNSTNTRRKGRGAKRRRKDSTIPIAMTGTKGVEAKTSIVVRKTRKRRKRKGLMTANPDHTKDSIAGTMVDGSYDFSFIDSIIIQMIFSFPKTLNASMLLQDIKIITPLIEELSRFVD
jgi:hypothetical protein